MRRSFALRVLGILVAFALLGVNGSVVDAADATTVPIKKLVPWKGGKTPPLQLRTIDGKPLSLGEHRGKVVLVNFWATWCEPCREEMPAMQKLKERYAGRLAVMAVNFGEGEPRIREFLQKVPVEFDQLLDTEKRSSKDWGVRILPTSFLIGPDGQVKHAVIGEFDWMSDEALKAVEALLRK